METQAALIFEEPEPETVEWLAAQGLCLTCGRIYTPINPATERPYRYCQYCRWKAAKARQEAAE